MFRCVGVQGLLNAREALSGFGPGDPEGLGDSAVLSGRTEWSHRPTWQRLPSWARQCCLGPAVNKRMHNPKERAVGRKGASETPTGNQREGEPDRGRTDAATALRPHGAPTMGKSGEGRPSPQSPLLQVLWPGPHPHPTRSESSGI